MERKGKVLIVDDDLLTRDRIKLYLKIIGFEIYTAVDGLDALEKLKTIGDLKMIFSDYEMPNMNGLQFLERVKRNAAYQKTLFIMLTSVDKPDAIESAKKLGVTAYMIKPFNNQKMQEVMQKIGL